MKNNSYLKIDECANNHEILRTLHLGIYQNCGFNKTFFPYFKKNIKLYGPFLWMGFNCLKARATSRRQFTFYHWVPRNSWYSFYRSRKDERLSQPWSHSVVLSTGPLDWESSALTTRPLLHVKMASDQLLHCFKITASDQLLHSYHLLHCKNWSITSDKK